MRFQCFDFMTTSRRCTHQNGADPTHGDWEGLQLAQAERREAMPLGEFPR
jgi:hypothetical protein